MSRATRKACPKGSFSGFGAASCEPCRKGTYGDFKAMARRKQCPEGIFNPEEESKGVSDCVPCRKERKASDLARSANFASRGDFRIV